MSAELLLRLDNQPCFQNAAFAAASEASQCPTGTIELVHATDSGIVCNSAFDAGRLVYGPSYQNEQGHSPSFQRHLSSVVDLLQSHLRDMRVVEVGCGKGTFLRMLRTRGFNVVGFDPAFEGNDEGVIRGTFSREAAGACDAVILRHVIEHIPSPLDFLGDLSRQIGRAAVVYVEVPCLEWILRRRAWFDVFYEHVNYFREEDFHRMFGKVYQSGHLFDGQYLYALAELTSLRKPWPSSKVRFPDDFFKGRDIAASAASAAGVFGIWGAGAKGTMFASHLYALGLDSRCAIDINPAKQGRFMPRSAVPIVSPSQGQQLLPEGTTVFVMNSNYLSEVLDESANRYLCRPIDCT
jgi:SAM-dependent methyltransferase